VIDVIGKQLKEIVMSQDGLQTISLEGYANGFYILSLSKENLPTLTSQIVVER